MVVVHREVVVHQVAAALGQVEVAEVRQEDVEVLLVRGAASQVVVDRPSLAVHPEAEVEEVSEVGERKRFCDPSHTKSCFLWPSAPCISSCLWVLF